LQEAGAVIGGRHGAAARLGLKRTTLLSKMQRLGITRNTNYTPVTGKEEHKELPQPVKS
jgi:formate hydrogenlyase transcriptional activator